MPRYFTVPEAAEILGITQHVVRHHIRKGNLSAERADSNYVISDLVLYDFIRQRVMNKKVRNRNNSECQAILDQQSEHIDDAKGEVVLDDDME
jgi:DNA-binding transcriptional MerR regulator